MEKITSIKQLRIVCNTEEPEDFFILLGVGARSSKSIMLTEDGAFNIVNEIDDSEETLTEDELKESNIGIAIKHGNFYLY